MMDGTMKLIRKRERKIKSSYLLTGRKIWLPESLLHPSFGSLLADYTTNHHLVMSIGEEDVEKVIVDVFQLQTYHKRYMKCTPAEGVDEIVNSGDLFPIKTEEDKEKENEMDSSLLLSNMSMPVEKRETESTNVTSCSKEVLRRDRNDNLMSVPSLTEPVSKILGLIKTVNGVIQYECDYCGKMFKARWRINKHRTKHSKERNFKCDGCMKTFKHHYDLNRHIRQMHGAHLLTTPKREFKCDICPKSYTTQQNLKVHIRKHWRDEYERKKKGDDASIEVNGQTVYGDKQIKCEKCGMEFMDGGWLVQHQKLECYFTALQALRTNKLGVYKGKNEKMSLELKPRLSLDFEVEKILGISDDGRYQVQWAPAWVSKFHLVGCEHLIQEFLQQQTQEIKPESDIQLYEPYVQYDQGPSEYVQESQDQSMSETRGEPQRGIGSFNETRTCEHLLHNSLQCLTKLVSCIQHETPEPSVEKKDDSGQVSENAVMVAEGPTSSEQLSSETEETENTYLETENDFVHSENMYSSDRYDATGVENMESLDPNEAQVQSLDKQYQLDNSTPDENLHNPRGQSHFCTVCEKEFSSFIHFQIHMSIHPNNNFVCPYCQKTFNSKENLNQHLSDHTKEMNQHLSDHTKEKPYSCNLCDYSSARMGDLKKHIALKKHKKSHTCNACGKAFSNSNSLRKHLQTH